MNISEIKKQLNQDNIIYDIETEYYDIQFKDPVNIKINNGFIFIDVIGIRFNKCLNTFSLINKNNVFLSLIKSNKINKMEVF